MITELFTHQKHDFTRLGWVDRQLGRTLWILSCHVWLGHNELNQVPDPSVRLLCLKEGNKVFDSWCQSAVSLGGLGCGDVRGTAISYDRLGLVIVRRAGLLWSQRDFEWRWSVPLFKCLTVLEFSFILFDLCFLITFFNFIMNYVPIVTFWIFTYHKIWILSIMFCSIWSYWIIYFLACLEVSWRVVS